MTQILVVDDSDDFRRMFEVILKHAAIGDIVLDRNAEAAIVRLGSARCEIDLVLMDISLPGMSGIDAIGVIRGMPHRRDLPIIVITAHSDVAHLQAAFEAGATDFVTKASSSVELLQRVRAALRLKEDVDRRKAREAELVDTQQRLTDAHVDLALLAQIDSLTGLPNRRQFDSVLRRELLRARREQTELSLLMIDVDHLKLFNEHFGQRAGDECLRRVAETVQRHAKRPADLAARYGGEEFAVILPVTPAGGAQQVAEAIRRSVRELALPHHGSPINHYVTVSVGLSTVPPGSVPAIEVIEAADQALYRAKKNGRNRVECEREPPTRPAAVRASGPR